MKLECSSSHSICVVISRSNVAFSQTTPSNKVFTRIVHVFNDALFLRIWATVALTNSSLWVSKCSAGTFLMHSD
eukprot:187428-Amphidinium_carterae.1